MRSHHYFLLVLLFIALLTNISPINKIGLNVVSGATQPKYGGTLVSTIPGDPPYFNPAFTAGTTVQVAGGNIFNSLIRRDAQGELLPDLADSWEISKDGLAYTFHLVKNATWHDGKPFTSADVKFSIEQVLSKFHARASVAFPELDRVDAPDPYTAIVRMKSPYAPFLSYVANTYMVIVPKHLYEGSDILKNPYNLNPIGTGPFVFKEYVKGDHITLVRNENYFRKGKPYLDKVVLKIIPDDTSRLLAYDKGEIDYLQYQVFPYSEIERLKSSPGTKVTSFRQPFSQVLELVFNLRNPPFNDMRVRQGIAYAINKQEIVDKAYYGFAEVATGPVHTDYMWAYNSNVTKYDFDLGKANKILDDAGYLRGPDGIRFKTSIVYDRGWPDAAKGAEIVMLRLREVGIDVLLRPSDRPSFEQDVAGWKYEMYVHPLPGGPDPAGGLSYLWAKNILHVFGVNTSGYNNSRFNWLYEQGYREMDQKKRAEYYYEAEQIAVRDLPHIYIAYRKSAVAFKAEFEGLPEDIWGFGCMDSVSWTKGSELSPEAIQAQITNVGKQLEGLKAQFYDVGAAQKQLEQAKQALAAGDYAKASELARSAVGVAQPPYALYGAVLIAVLVVSGLLLRKRKLSKRTV